METDRTKRRLNEFEKIRITGTSTEFDRGYMKGVKLTKERVRIERIKIREANRSLYEENQELKRKLIVCQIRIEKLCVKKKVKL